MYRPHSRYNVYKDKFIELKTELWCWSCLLKWFYTIKFSSLLEGPSPLKITWSQLIRNLLRSWGTSRSSLYFIIHKEWWVIWCADRVTYLLKTFLCSLERAVLAFCFRSLRLGCFFFFFLLPFLVNLSEPRSSPVAASMSRISSASRQSGRDDRRWSGT